MQIQMEHGTCRKAGYLFAFRLAIANEGGFIIKKHRSTFFLGMLLIILSILSLFIGAMEIDLKTLLQPHNPMEFKIFLLARIPRLLAILCTGFGMSVAGLIMQQICMNKFVSPTTGATIQSAQFGILLSLIFLPSLGFWGRVILSFTMAIGGTWLFIWFVQRIQFKNTALVPLVGIMFGNILGGITSFLAYKFELTQQLSTYLVGSFSLIIKGKYELVYLVLPLILIAFVYTNHFNIVGLGRDFSQNLGIGYNRVLFLGLTIAAMITASIVIIVGQISYIGLILPNIVSLWKGDKIQGTLTDTALLGGIFVLVSDIFARSIIRPYELPVELVTGILGSILFLGMLIRKLHPGGGLHAKAK